MRRILVVLFLIALVALSTSVAFGQGLPCAIATTDRSVFPADRSITLSVFGLYGGSCPQTSLNFTTGAFVTPMLVFSEYDNPVTGWVSAKNLQTTNLQAVPSGPRQTLITLEPGAPEGFYRFIVTDGTSFMQTLYFIWGNATLVPAPTNSESFLNPVSNFPVEFQMIPNFRSSAIVEYGVPQFPGALPPGVGSVTAVIYQLHGPGSAQGQEHGWVEAYPVQLVAVEGSDYAVRANLANGAQAWLKVVGIPPNNGFESDRTASLVGFSDGEGSSETIFEPTSPTRYFTGWKPQPQSPQ